MSSIVTTSRIECTVDGFEPAIAAAIREQAEESARLCLEHGWDPAGAEYDIAGMPGDAQALGDRLGRKATREEVRALEVCVRHMIADAGSTGASMALDLWEDNAGGLMLVDRERAMGWRGFERGQNERRHRASPRDEFTLASDAPEFDALGEGSAYEPMSAADIEELYEREGETNAPVRVARWQDGRITVRDVCLGAAARWYLDLADEGA